MTTLREKLLGIINCQEGENIKKAYYKQSLIYHPDRTTGDEEKFKEINRAYTLLTNPDKFKEVEEEEEVIINEINTIKDFLRYNDIEYTKENAEVEYYRKIIKTIMEQFTYLLNFTWRKKHSRFRKLNQYILYDIIDLLDSTHQDIQKIITTNRYLIDLDRLETMVFIVHSSREKIYDTKIPIDNNKLVDMFNFILKALEERPLWDLLI